MAHILSFSDLKKKYKTVIRVRKQTCSFKFLSIVFGYKFVFGSNVEKNTRIYLDRFQKLNAKTCIIIIDNLIFTITSFVSPLKRNVKIIYENKKKKKSSPVGFFLNVFDVRNDLKTIRTIRQFERFENETLRYPHAYVHRLYAI